MANPDGKVALYNRLKGAQKLLACAGVVELPGRGPSGPGVALVSPSQAAWLLDPKNEKTDVVTSDRSEAMSGLKIYRATYSQEQYDELPKLDAYECAAGIKLLSAGEETWDVKDHTANQLRTRLSQWMSGPQREIGQLPIHPEDKAMKEAAAIKLQEKAEATKAAQATIAREAREKAEAEAKAELLAKAAEEAKSEDPTEEVAEPVEPVAAEAAVTPGVPGAAPPATEIPPEQYAVVTKARGQYVVIDNDTGEKVHDKEYLKKSSAEALLKRKKAGK